MSAERSRIMSPKQAIIKMVIGFSFLFAIFAGTAFGGEAILTVAGNVSPPTDVYFYPEWKIDNAALTNTTVISESYNYWFVALAAPGTFTWSDSILDQENSSGGLADATFLAGGRITMTGMVMDTMGNWLNPSDPTILEADVSAFRLIEQYATSNEIVNRNDSVQRLTITPTGGFLLNNTVSGGMNLAGDYYMEIQVSNCQELGGDLETFGNDIHSLAGMQFNLVQVPEPSTLILLAGTIIFFIKRR